uniref:Fe2OG dioxygenase domain-containing protein n=1 Tax=Chromera velia CCMP2878 TaxID=1169474 RepID=A0A0G4IB55_9ALVE|mmetsp:Transcript_35998/g.70830  ORF Transcript_35998/g.70830 Transcript_35998/m.70830 type:complete len:268 (+) Transcript_35998:49-852(+)|eukprot:Cvel_12657.t1-p1 / transcript=Cvel_12657.t1 / gene=Cvel_12657 / organism=Chromera_velia_CCMP2878 / gene_product=hypothetical protein / transcript_product=hypothetical protein / location=Cvel_scaffold836:22884-23684(-) / protein_length=267 / sequence_SO=supercontig / SO=protein_coding / is_pseudo=false
MTPDCNDPLSAFRADGYVVSPRLLEVELPALLTMAKDALKREPGEKFASAHWNEGGFLFDDRKRLFKVQGAALHMPELIELAFGNSKVLDLVRHVCDFTSALDVFGTKFFPLWPLGGRSVGWHQDHYYFGTESSRQIISCGVYLEDTDRENGCLRIIPKSHLLGRLLEHSGDGKAGGFESGEWVDMERCPELLADAVDVAVPAGSVVLFDARVLHAAYENRTADRTRLSLFGHYVPQSLQFQWRGTDFSYGLYADRHHVGHREGEAA